MEGWAKAPEHLILYAASEHNILTITSKCNVHCIFCSHHQNPPGVKTYYVEEQSLDNVKAYAEFLGGEKKIVIGESASKISEGEPFTHPEIMPILQYLRRKFPRTPLQLTTNGSLLTDKIIAQLAELMPVELYLSINSINAEGRLKLMADRSSPGINLLEKLKKANLVFHGSLVAMPWIVGWDDLEQTIYALDTYGAKTIRVFMPGYSRLAPPRLRFPQDMWQELSRFVNGLKLKLGTPLTLEPPHLADLTAEVAGIIKGSSGARAGLLPGDVILSINGIPPFSRVDAYKKALNAEYAELVIKRGREQHTVSLTKQRDEASGLVMEYDVSREEIEEILSEVQRRGAERPLLMASLAGYQVLQAGLLKAAPQAAAIEIQPVPNDFVGGSIITAGLLTVEDFKAQWRKMENWAKSKSDLLILPAKAFDHKGQDLTGQSYLELADFTGVPAVIL